MPSLGPHADDQMTGCQFACHVHAQHSCIGTATAARDKVILLLPSAAGRCCPEQLHEIVLNNTLVRFLSVDCFHLMQVIIVANVETPAFWHRVRTERKLLTGLLVYFSFTARVFPV